jgi:hypothetical protein
VERFLDFILAVIVGYYFFGRTAFFGEVGDKAGNAV